MLSLYRNKKRTINIVLITKSYDKSAWCNFSVHCLYFLEKESRATKIGCPAFLEYDSGITPYFLFCLCCCNCSCCFCIASRRAANPVFFICFGSFFFASRIANNLVSSVVLRSRIIVPTLISVDTK